MSALDRHLRPRARRSAHFWLFPLVLGAVASVIGYADYRDSAALARLDTANDALAAVQVKSVVAKPRPADAEQQKRWAELRAERDFPWQLVFQSVERSDRSNIELLEFRPDKRNRRIILRGEARDREALSAYLQALAELPTLSQVHLLHRQALIRDKLTTVGFEIKVTIR